MERMITLFFATKGLLVALYAAAEGYPPSYSAVCVCAGLLMAWVNHRDSKRYN